MRFRYLVVAALLGALCAFGVTVALGASKKKSSPGALYALATGKKEVSPTGKKGVGDRNGRAGFTAVIDGTQFCWGITVKNVDKPNAAHIHKGRPTVFGDIVIPLKEPTDGNPGASSGCTTISAGLARAIKKNPAKYYFNLHTDDFPTGAVRGQLFAKRR